MTLGWGPWFKSYVVIRHHWQVSLLDSLLAFAVQRDRGTAVPGVSSSGSSHSISSVSLAQRPCAGQAPYVNDPYWYPGFSLTTTHSAPRHQPPSIRFDRPQRPANVLPQGFPLSHPHPEHCPHRVPVLSHVAVTATTMARQEIPKGVFYRKKRGVDCAAGRLNCMNEWGGNVWCTDLLAMSGVCGRSSLTRFVSSSRVNRNMCQQW